jgi:predicted O-linked N-acetylglucosamine transferase (SPINDLY family)
MSRRAQKAEYDPPPPALEAAIAHHQAGRIADAEALYRSVLDLDPGNLDALHLLGVVELQCGRSQNAIDLISRSLAGNPQNHHALNHLGEAYRALGFLDEAKTCFERTLSLKEDYVQAHNNLGNVYQADGRLELAISCFRNALEINPEYAEAHNNLANALQESGEWGAAIACYERALALRPDFAEASFNLGNLYKTLRRYDEAIPWYRQTILQRPALIEAHLALGRSYQEIGERERALECFEHVASVQPENAEARWALVFTELALVYDDHGTVANFRDAFVRGLDALDLWFSGDRIGSGFNAVGTQQPFFLAYHEENNREILSRYGALCQRLAGFWQHERRLVLRNPKRKKRIRVGIVSAHVSDHSVWHALVKGWCQNLDTERFELDIFSLGKMIDRETQIAESCASRFLHGLVRPQQWAEAILAERIDVLIYPEIGMDPMTAKLANLRLSPIQATTWGHPETSGLPTIDYYISAADFEPVGAQSNYCEKLFLLPNLGCCYHPLDIATEDLSLAEYSIESGRPLFVCPGTPFKYAPQHDWIYPAIARELRSCQFIFFKYPLETLSRRFMERLEAAFTAAGLQFKEHVITVPWLSKPRFNSLMRQATGFLDTIGFSGFNTAIQAIECGLPVVTREGRFLRGRLASGVLRRMGRTELIAESEQDYVDLAIRLGSDSELRADLRDRIGRSKYALYDDLAPVRALESFLACLAKV